jgi:hypothetical protein
MVKNKLVGLDLPSVMGMGISGPVLAFLTATINSAFGVICGWDSGAYAIIMLVLSGILATFPVSKSSYGKWQKVAMWPIATVMIFSSAWGINSGLSAGEEAVSAPATPRVAYAMAPLPMTGGSEIPEGVPMAPSSTDTNDIDIVEIPGSYAGREIPVKEQSMMKGGFFKRFK